MLKFIDINTGNLFVAHKRTDPDPGVVSFWFDANQSTRLIYTKQIWFLSDENSIQIGLDQDQQIFRLIDIEKLQTSTPINIGGFSYNDINSDGVLCTQLESTGTQYNNEEYYIHTIYLYASCPIAGQYDCSLYIENDEYSIGADFYDEDETLLINLANQGQEIPESIQRAIYDVNVHEENNDNITLNNKWKELLMNSWDTFVCKGSYKSLINTLKWFGYGDNLRISEYWKHNIAGKDVFIEDDMSSLLTEKYRNSLTEYSKTTYIGVHLALNQIDFDPESGSMEYDDGWSKNPKLSNAIYKWTIQDMMLKMSLLGNFYKTYFMPIHLDLLQCVAENTVYTDAINILGKIDKSVYHNIYNCDTFSCNVHNGDEFFITNESVQVGPKTILGHQYGDNDVMRPSSDDSSSDSYDSMYTVGVDFVIDSKLADDSSSDMANNAAKTFWSQHLNYPAAIVPFHCIIKTNGSSIIREIISFTNRNGERVIHTGNNIIKSTEQKCYVDFNILYLHPIENEHITIQFITSDSKLYTKTLSINIIDEAIPTIKIYRVVPDDDNALDINKKSDLNNVFESAFDTIEDNQNIPIYKQFIPFNNNSSIESAKPSNILILGGNLTGNVSLNEDYFTFLRSSSNWSNESPTPADSWEYTICVSKKFKYEVPKLADFKSKYGIDDNTNIYRNDLGFIPEFHHLKEICRDDDSDNIENYTSNIYESLCVIPWFIYKDGVAKPLKYTGSPQDCQWLFINKSKLNDIIELPIFETPLMASKSPKPLDPGYYSIEFTYKLHNNIKTIRRNSAILIKKIEENTSI